MVYNFDFSWLLLKRESIFLFATTLVLLLFLAFVSRVLKYSQQPPGPWGLPWVGYAPFIKEDQHICFSKLARKFGDVMMINLMGQNVVHLNSFAAIREAYAQRGHQFAGKPQDQSFFHWITDGLGVAQSEGPAWKEHRRFTLHTMRDFGFGKLSLEERVLEIIEDLLKVINDSRSQPIDIHDDLSNCTCNVICSLLFDKHYARDHPEFLATRSRIETVFSTFRGARLFLTNFLPIPLTPGYSKVVELKRGFVEFINKQVTEHQATFDPQNLRDYLDVYLEERRQLEDNGRLTDSTFSIQRLSAIAFNLFVAGTETVTATAYYGFKLLLVHTDVQTRIQAEIDQVIGKQRPPSITDRSQMPFTEATIMEIHRFATIVPFIPVHSNFEESTLRGFTIPKRCTILGNLWSLNRDSERYPNPESFQPNRFLKKDGTLKKEETLIPFSIGKRSCLGESLARMELFLFFTSVLQRFTLRFPEGEENENFNCGTSFVRVLKSFRISATPRI